MSIVKFMIVMLLCAMFFGCVSQQTHDRAMEELTVTHKNSAQEVERLQQVVQEKEAAVVQLQEANKELESTVKVQEQDKEEHLKALKEELQALYSEVSGLGGMSGTHPSNFSIDMKGDGVDFDNLAKFIRNMRSTIESQVKDFSQLRELNGQLEEDLQQLEARLWQVREDREAQEAKLAKVKQEVQTVGKEIDRITQALEEKFGKSLVVTQHQDRLVLTMLGQVLFESGKSQLTPLGLDIMKQVGEVLATLPNKNIQVEGHTDNNPIYGRLQRQYPTNWELSTARATTVLRYLIEQTGMNPTDFAATGYADTRPAAANTSEEGRAQNRRVEIVLYPERVLEDTQTVATLAN